MHSLSRITGLSRTPIRRGQVEIGQPPAAAPDRVRRPGGGRLPVEKTAGRGDGVGRAVGGRDGQGSGHGLEVDAQDPGHLGRALKRQGFRVGRTTVRRLLGERGYALRVNRKRRSQRPDPRRDRQMRYTARRRRAYFRAGCRRIRVDPKKKELIGNVRNPGRAWRRHAREALATDFLSDADGKAIPYRVYDRRRHAGLMAIGTSHETAALAARPSRTWWRRYGAHAYAGQDRLVILADGGGANPSASWCWKVGLQALADEFALTITVMHYPPGASKWNPIEHRLFSPISLNWQGQPLVSYAVMLKLIRATTTQSGLTCRACLDTTDYPTRLKVTAEEKAHINLVRHRVFPDWNCTIRPRAQARED